MPHYIQRSKAKFKTIMDAWKDIIFHTKLDDKAVSPAHTRCYWKWKLLQTKSSFTK